MLKNNGKLLLFLTEKHASHDNIWMFQNSSSNSVCFACAVETLDDATSLNVRKRRMVSDIMELLATNRSIWEIFTRQEATLCHTGNVLLKLLSSKDKQLSSLVVELLGILVQKSKEDNAISLLQSLATVLHSKELTKNLENIAPYFCFLGKILRRSGSTVKKLLTDHHWLVEMIIENTADGAERQAISYWYILAQIYKSEHSRHVNIRSSKLVLEKVLSALGNSVSKDLQLNILSVFMSFAKSRFLCELIIDDETEYALPQNSIANVMKKLMLSTNSDIQKVSVQCLTEVLKTSAHENEKSANFSQTLMAKGLCEFLFELLGSEERLLLSSVLNCLQYFADVKMFFSAGHIIYGREPIIESLRRAIKGKDKFLMYPALNLQLKILENTTNSSSIEKHVSCFLELIVELSEVQDTNILNLAISCATETMKNNISGQLDLATIMVILERFGKRLSKKAASRLGKNSSDPDTINLLKNTLNFVKCSIQLLTDENSQGTERNINEYDNCTTQQSSTHELHLQEIQRNADLYLIPSTVMLLPFVIEHEVFNNFFDILSFLVENSTDKAFAKKLCEASFVRIALEVKAGLLREDQASKSGTFIDNFLVLLACKLDDTRDKIGLQNTLTEVFSFLQTAPGEWHLFFNKSSSSIDMNIVHPIRLACISLLYMSVRFGDPLWKSDLLLRCLSNCMKDEQQFHDLPCSLKRHIIYLWAYSRNVTDTADADVLCADKQIMSLIEKEPTKSNLFIPEGHFIHWIISSKTDIKIKSWALSEIFLLGKNSGSDSERAAIEDVLKSLALYRSNHEFYVICMDILAYGTPSVVTEALDSVTFVTRDVKNAKIFSHMKVIINKILLSNGSELEYFNLAAILEFYIHIQLSPVFTISDVDLKLASRLGSLFLEYSITEIRTAILNSLNQFLFHINSSGSASQVAVVCNDMFLKEVDSFIPRQLAEECDGSKSEQLSSASLVFLSQLMTTISSQKFPIMSIQPIIVQKETLILQLACSDLPLIQLACLQFWNCFFTLSQANVFIFQNEEEPLDLFEDDLQLILIYIQNLLLNEKQLIRELSMKVLFQVVEALKVKDSDFHSPWDAFILQHLLDALAPDTSDLEFKVKTMLFLLKNGTILKDRTVIVSPIMWFIKSELQGIHIEAINALLQIIGILAKDVQLSTHQITDINKFLHSLEDDARGLLTEQKIKETTRPPFTVYRNVLFPVYKEDSISMNVYLESITECKGIVNRQ